MSELKPPIRPEDREEKPLPTPEEVQEEIDKHVPQAVEVLSKLLNSCDRDSTKRQAAVDILERSSIAPLKRQYIQGQGPGGVTIQIGIQKLNQIKAALEDVEAYETLELLEGEGYEQEEA